MILLLLLSHVRCLLLHSIGAILLQFMMSTLRHGTKIILSVLKYTLDRGWYSSSLFEEPSDFSYRWLKKVKDNLICNTFSSCEWIEKFKRRAANFLIDDGLLNGFLNRISLESLSLIIIALVLVLISTCTHLTLYFFTYESFSCLCGDSRPHHIWEVVPWGDLEEPLWYWCC